jgi:hypothetical protein
VSDGCSEKTTSLDVETVIYSPLAIARGISVRGGYHLRPLCDSVEFYVHLRYKKLAFAPAPTSTRGSSEYGNDQRDGFTKLCSMYPAESNFSDNCGSELVLKELVSALNADTVQDLRSLLLADPNGSMYPAESNFSDNCGSELVLEEHVSELNADTVRDLRSWLLADHNGSLNISDYAFLSFLTACAGAQLCNVDIGHVYHPSRNDGKISESDYERVVIEEKTGSPKRTWLEHHSRRATYATKLLDSYYQGSRHGC